MKDCYQITDIDGRNVVVSSETASHFVAFIKTEEMRDEVLEELEVTFKDEGIDVAQIPKATIDAIVNTYASRCSDNARDNINCLYEAIDVHYSAVLKAMQEGKPNKTHNKAGYDERS